MSLGLNETNQNGVVDATLRVLRIIWLAILAGVVALFVVTRLINPAVSEENRFLFWVLLAMGLMTLGASFIIKQRFLSQAIRGQNLAQAQIAYIAAFALCEATGIFGLVAFIITGVEYYYLFFVLSGFGVILHKPLRDDLLLASGAIERPMNSWKASS